MMELDQEKGTVLFKQQVAREDVRKMFADYAAEDGNDPVEIITTRPDAEVAAELKKEAETKLLELCGTLNRASRAGFVIGFNVGHIPSGWVIQQLTIAKHF